MNRSTSFFQSIAPTSHWLLGPVRDNSKIYAQTITAALIINFLGLVSSFFIMTVYDRVLPNQAIESLIALTIGVLIAHIFDFCLKSLRGYFIDIAGQRLDAVVGAKVFDNLMAMKMENRKGGVGAMASLVREFESLRDFFSSATLAALVDLPFLFLFIATIAFIGGPMAIIPAIAVLAALIGGLLIQPLIMRHTQAAVGQGQSKHGVLIETLAGLETVKSVAASSMMRDRWRRGVLQHAKTSAMGRLLGQAAVNFAGFAQQIAQVGVVVLGVFLVGENAISMGALIACVILTGRAMAPLGQVASLLGKLSGAMSSYKSLNALMSSQMEVDENREYLRRKRFNGGIEFREVSFQYPKSSSLSLDEVSFTIAPGEKVGILGRNGSGKSTIVRLLTGVCEPTEGSVLVDDTDLRQLHPEDFRANVGAVLQDVCLFSGSIRENIALGLEKITDEHVLLASKVAGVHDFVGATDAGYDRRLGERGEGLSGGQRQSIALARALAANPSILLLDEPSSALDTQSEATLIARLSKVTRGKTLLLVTHKISMLKLVDRIIVLDQGRIVVDGRKDEILRAMTRVQQNKDEAAPVTRLNNRMRNLRANEVKPVNRRGAA